TICGSPRRNSRTHRRIRCASSASVVSRNQQGASTAQAFRPTKAVPKGGVGTAAPLTHSAQSLIKSLRAKIERASNDCPRGFNHADDISDKGREFGGPRA